MLLGLFCWSTSPPWMTKFFGFLSCFKFTRNWGPSNLEITTKELCDFWSSLTPLLNFLAKHHSPRLAISQCGDLLTFRPKLVFTSHRFIQNHSALSCSHLRINRDQLIGKLLDLSAAWKINPMRENRHPQKKRSVTLRFWQYRKTNELKKKEILFFHQRHALLMSLDIFVVTYVTTFCQNWSTCYYFLWKKLNFHFFLNSLFRVLPRFLALVRLKKPNKSFVFLSTSGKGLGLGRQSKIGSSKMEIQFFSTENNSMSWGVLVKR